MNSKREILRDFNCPANSPDSSYVQKISTHRRYFTWGRRGLTDESEHRKSPSEAAQQTSFASRATSGLDMQGQSRVASLVDHIPETSHPLTRRDQRPPPLLLTYRLGSSHSSQTQRRLSNLLGSGGKTTAEKGWGLSGSHESVNLFTQVGRCPRTSNRGLSSPDFSRQESTSETKNSFSVSLRSLIFYTQADNKEKKQESGRAGTEGGGEWLGPKSQKRSKYF